MNSSSLTKKKLLLVCTLFLIVGICPVAVRAAGQLSSNTYITDRSDSLLKGVEAGTSAAELMANMDNDPGNLQVWAQDKSVYTGEAVSTGMSIQLFDDDAVCDSLTIVVNGDPSGDGMVSATDYVLVRLHILGLRTLDGAYLDAGDVSGNGVLSIADYTRLRLCILGLRALDNGRPQPDETVMGTVVNCTTTTDVRKGPGSSYALLGQTAKGMVYIVQEQKESWYAVQYAGGTGYIHKDYLDTAVPSCGEVLVRIATFNVKVCDYGRRINEISELIKASGADIVGIQEVERNCVRTNYLNIPVLLAQKTGLEHHVFAKSITYRGGDYGTLILSRYPIIESSVTPLTTLPSVEGRSVCYASILTGTRPLNLFNTHLSNESEQANAVTLGSLEAYLLSQNHDEFVVTGDFNALSDTVLSYISRVSAANSFYKTHLGREIDNILYTSGISVSGLTMIDSVTPGYSDHNMLVCNVTLPGK